MRRYTKYNFIAGMLVTIACFIIVSCAGHMTRDEEAAFTVETVAMAIGYEYQDFTWTDNAERLYQAIVADGFDIVIASEIQSAFKDDMHPVLINRILALANMIGGFEFENGTVIDVSRVDTELLKAAARGFKAGVELR